MGLSEVVMIDTSKLKYYKTLCDKGVLNEQQNDLDYIMNTLEEKQFEYLKRLETTKNESRKDEINELLNMIDMQLKELAAIKTTLSSGIIIENAIAEAANNKPYEQSEELIEKPLVTETIHDVPKQKKDKGNSKMIIAIGVLAFVIAVSAFAITNSINSLNNSRDNGGSELADDTTTAESIETADDSSNDEDNNETMFGINGIDDGLSAQAQLDIDEQIFTEGYYVLDITNKSLVDGGLELGDKILTMNGEKVLTGQDFYDISAKYKPGDELILVVERNHEELTIKGVYVTESDLLPYRSGMGTFKVNGHTFDFNYDEGILTLKD